MFEEKKIEKLKRRVRELDADNQSLKSENRILKKELADYEAGIFEPNDEIKELLHELEDKNKLADKRLKEIDEYEREMQANLAEIRSLKSKVKAELKEILKQAKSSV